MANTIDLAACRRMRRRWIKLDTRAKAVASNIGRCTSDKANAWWQERADRWQRLADMQHAKLKALIGLTGHEPRTTSADRPPSINWQSYTTNTTETDTDELEPIEL